MGASDEDDMFAPAAGPSARPKGGLFESLTSQQTSATSADAEQINTGKRAAEGDVRQEEAAKRARGEDSGGRSEQRTAPPPRQPPGVTAIRAAYSEDKGSRTAMEDVAVITLDGRADPSAAGSLRISFFGVFDGHGGRQVAQHVAEKLHSAVMAAGLAAEAENCARAGTAPSVKACRAAITAGFKQLDEAVLRKCAAEGWADGATAVAVWVMGETVLVANVGDAKCVLARRPPPAATAAAAVVGGGDGTSGGQSAGGSGGSVAEGAGLGAGPATGEGVAGSGSSSAQREAAGQAGSGTGTTAVQSEQYKAITLTREHRAIYPQERQRIERAGGFVSGDGRLGGRVEVSRAFGDRAFKKQGMSSVPDIQAFQISPREAFLLCGCDGFWGVFSPQDAVEFVSREVAKGYDTKQVTQRLIYEAIREKHCKDNCTILMIQLGV